MSALEAHPADASSFERKPRGEVSPTHGGLGASGGVVVVDRQASESKEPGDAIYRCYAPELLKFATGLVGPWVAADIVHDAIIRCLQAPTWERIVDKRGYLYRAVLNASRSHHRASRRHQDRVQLAATREQVASHEPDLRPEVWAAVLTLSVRQRAVIVLTYWQDLAPEQVAERLQISEGSVKQHLARGRERLRRIFSDG
jgi:RNA polymerase sigma factor (sigma-70 family)